jgi:hypothetical protein
MQDLEKKLEMIDKTVHQRKNIENICLRNYTFLLVNTSYNAPPNTWPFVAIVLAYLMFFFSWWIIHL